jgi:hypothetical protein
LFSHKQSARYARQSAWEFAPLLFSLCLQTQGNSISKRLLAILPFSIMPINK